MLKKFKILMLIIILSLTGIVSVISIWLYGSYRERLEFSVTEVERSLFNSVQNYYNASNGASRDSTRAAFRKFDTAGFVKELNKAYSHSDTSKVFQLVDSLLINRFSPYSNRKDGPKHFSHRSIVTPFDFEQVDFDSRALVSIESSLDSLLRDKGIYFKVDLALETIEDKKNIFRYKFTVDSLGYINSRAVLVNPEHHLFLKAKFLPPVSHVLSKMLGQLIVAFLMIFGLIGTFIYLFWTINRQNKLAILRKSFVNNMTHELKTPVATVMAAIEAVQRYGARDDKAKMDKYLSISQQELSHLANMIEKVLQLDMDEVKGILLNKESINLTVLVSEVLELVKLGATKNVEIDLFVSDQPIFINIDVAHFKNVLNNLLDNAIKYSAEPAQVHVSIHSANNKEIIIEIRDFGIGIATNYQSSIFEMFFRVPSGDLHPVKGFGLGLAYVKQVVEQHSGTVSVTSELGKGTSFSIRLPL